MGEVFSTMARLEGAKKDLETQISNVASLLHHVRSSSAHSTSRSRPSTPNRSSRASNNHRASSFQETSAFSSKNSGGEVDFEQIKGESFKTGSYTDSCVLTIFSELVMLFTIANIIWFPFTVQQNAHDNFTNFSIHFFRSLGDIRDLVGKISQAAKDRDESLHQVASLKRQNDQLLENTVGLEEKLSTQKKKSRSFEDQLRKVELKVAHSDANLADQVIK